MGVSLNLPHHIHALRHFSEGGKPHPVGVPLSAEIQFGLVVDADKEFGTGASGIEPRHGNRAVLMQKPRLRGRFMKNRGQAFCMVVTLQAALNHLNFYRIIRLVIHTHHAVKTRVRKTILVNILHEVCRGDGRQRRIYLNEDCSEPGFNHDWY